MFLSSLMRFTHPSLCLSLSVHPVCVFLSLSVTCLSACGTVACYRPSAGLIFIKAISAALDVSRAHRHSKSIPADRHRLPQHVSIPFRAALKVSSSGSALHSHLQLITQTDEANVVIHNYTILSITTFSYETEVGWYINT